MPMNLNNTTPAAPGSNVNVTWQADGSGNVSAYVTPGIVFTDYNPILVQNNYSASASCAYLYGNAGGNFLLVCLVGTAGNNPSAPTDTATNTWHEVGVGAQSEGAGGTQRYIRMYYAYNCNAYGLTSTGAVNTVASTNAATIEVYEFTGVVSSGDPYDVGAGVTAGTTSGTSANVTGGTLTTNYPGLVVTMGYGAAGTIAQSTATLNTTLTGVVQLSGPTFYKTGYYPTTVAGAVRLVLSDNTNAEAYCCIEVSFRLAAISTSAQWVGKSLAASANTYNSRLRLASPQTSVQVNWTYPVPVHVNGDFTLFLRTISSGTADQWGFGIHNNGPHAGFLGSPFALVPNSFAFVYEMYSSPGPTNSVGWEIGGVNAPAGYTFTATSPVSGNANHTDNITLAWTSSTKNMLFIMHDTTNNAIYSHNWSIDVAALLNGTTGYIFAWSTQGGLTMTVDCWGLKFVGPSETVDYTCGFSGLAIAG